MVDSTVEEQSTETIRTTRIRSFSKQRAKLAYLPPRAVSIARVSPLGYEEQVPDRRDARPLHEIRASRGLSVRKLAAKSGASVSTIYRIERGDTLHRPHVAYTVSSALACSPWEISEFWDILEGTTLPK